VADSGRNVGGRGECCRGPGTSQDRRDASPDNGHCNPNYPQYGHYHSLSPGGEQDGCETTQAVWRVVRRSGPQLWPCCLPWQAVSPAASVHGAQREASPSGEAVVLVVVGAEARSYAPGCCARARTPFGPAPFTLCLRDLQGRTVHDLTDIGQLSGAASHRTGPVSRLRPAGGVRGAIETNAKPPRQGRLCYWSWWARRPYASRSTLRRNRTSRGRSLGDAPAACEREARLRVLD
jgi:hypothetical protein